MPGLSESELQAYRAIDVAAQIVVTLFKDGKWVGNLGVHSATPRVWTTTEVRLAEETAERTWAAVERARAEARLRESEERLGLAIEVGQLASWDWDLRTGVIAWNDRHFLIQGYEPGEVTPSYDAWIARVHPGDRSEAMARIEQARATRQTYAHEFRTVRPDGSVRWCSSRGRFFYDGDEPHRMVGVMEDITDRKLADDALRESDERFRQFASASSGALWIRDAQSLRMEYVSAAIATTYGVAPDAFIGDIERWAAMIVPEDRAVALEHIEQARRGEAVVHEFRIQRPSDGAFRWIRDTDFPLHDAEGRIQRIGGIAEDVTDAKLAREHQGVLLSELQHRVRNIMAIIRSIAARTADGSANVPDYAERIAGRLQALGRVQALLTRGANVSASLRSVVHDEVSAQAHHAGQYVLDGPDIELSPKAAEVLTLAVHELATNALKYGALSVPDGRIHVTWRIERRTHAPWVIFDWTEEGAPAPAAGEARRRGFGSELIEGRIPYELKGRGELVIAPGGARCHLEFPLSGGASILETGAPQQATVSGGTLDMSGAPDLTGHRILVVEDDYYLATDLARALRSAGAEVVGPAPHEAEARNLLSRLPAAALLDLNLSVGPSFCLAETLREKGIPFVFVTGYDEETIPAAFKDVVRLQKPVELRQVVNAIAKLLAPS